MLFQQFYLQGLGHASYLGEAFVFDPDATVPSTPGDVLSMFTYPSRPLTTRRRKFR